MSTPALTCLTSQPSQKLDPGHRTAHSPASLLGQWVLHCSTKPHLTGRGKHLSINTKLKFIWKYDPGHSGAQTCICPATRGQKSQEPSSCSSAKLAPYSELFPIFTSVSLTRWRRHFPSASGANPWPPSTTAANGGWGPGGFAFLRTQTAALGTRTSDPNVTAALWDSLII